MPAKTRMTTGEKLYVLMLTVPAFVAVSGHHHTAAWLLLVLVVLLLTIPDPR